jgi:hypothetical protein
MPTEFTDAHLFEMLQPGVQPDPLADLDGQQVILAAVRHGLTRSGLLPGVCSRWLLRHRDRLAPSTQEKVVEDIIHTRLMNGFVDQEARDLFMAVAVKYWEGLPEDLRQTCRNHFTEIDLTWPWTDGPELEEAA